MRYSYIHQPEEIYRQSFEIVRTEANLQHLPAAMQPVATRLIHSCGMIDVVDDLAFSTGAAEAGLAALQNGRPIYCDVEMVRSGIIQKMLPAGNDVLCTLNDPTTADRAVSIGNTRSAAAVDLWSDLDGAVVVIGKAPTALFRLLENMAEGAGKPALIVGMPVGFVGAVESKQALAAFEPELNFIAVHGRRGGSAMASSVVNALAGISAS